MNSVMNISLIPNISVLLFFISIHHYSLSQICLAAATVTAFALLSFLDNPSNSGGISCANFHTESGSVLISSAGNSVFTFPSDVYDDASLSMDQTTVSLNISKGDLSFLLIDHVGMIFTIIDFLPVVSGVLSPFDTTSNGFDLVIQFHDEILTALLWKQPPWKPPWTMKRDLLFSEDASTICVSTLCDFPHMMHPIDIDALGRTSNSRWYHILVSPKITSRQMESKQALVKVQTAQLVLMKNIWRGSWSIILWVSGKDGNRFRLCMNKANLLFISPKIRVSESSLATFNLFPLIKVMPSAFWSFIKKMIANREFMEEGHNIFHLLACKASERLYPLLHRNCFNFLYLCTTVVLYLILYFVNSL